MTLINGGPAGPDGLGGAYQNTAESDRALAWDALGGWNGILNGFTHAAVPGEMALDFTAGAALVSERDAIGTWQNRGYHVWADTTTRVTFGPASVAGRNDALVIAFVDTEDGPVGTGGLDVGPHIVVVPGVSGVPTPLSGTDITSYLGRGGWIRVMDVPIASTDTEINVANVSLTVSARSPINRVQCGQESIAVGSSTAIFTQAVNFPIPYSEVPRVTTQVTESTSPFFYSATASSITTTGFNMSVQKTGPSGALTIECDWIAVGV